MARDILTILVSTVASEQDFSQSGRALEERRARLSEDILEAKCTLRIGRTLGGEAKNWSTIYWRSFVTIDWMNQVHPILYLFLLVLQVFPLTN